MKHALLLAGMLCMSACVWGPGMYMDEDAFRERYADKTDAGTPDGVYEIVPIDATLLKKQQEARLQERPAPKQDPLAEIAVEMLVSWGLLQPPVAVLRVSVPSRVLLNFSWAWPLG